MSPRAWNPRSIVGGCVVFLALLCHGNAASAVDPATFRSRALQAALQRRPHSEALVRPLLEAIIGAGPGSVEEAVEPLTKAHGDEVAAVVLAEALELDDEEARFAAADNLEKLGLGSLTVLPVLIAALQDPDEYVRSQVAAAIGEIGPEAHTAVPALIVALGDQSYHVRSRVSDALGKIRVHAKLVVPALIAALADDDEHVRFMTVEAIGEFGPEAASAVEPLRKALLHDPHPNVRWNAARPLAAVDPEGTIAIPALLEALQSSNANVRRFAAMALGTFGPQAKEAAPLLLAGLKDSDDGCRIAAAGALWKVSGNSQDAVPVLIQVLEREPDIAHLWAANEIAAIGPDARQAVPALRKSLAKTHWPDAPARALGSIGPDAVAAVPDLVASLDSKKGDLRSHAAAALWRIDAHPRAIPALLEELKDTANSSPYYALEAVGLVGPPAKAGVPDLLKHLANRTLYVRRAAAQALAKVDPAAVPERREPTPLPGQNGP